MSAYLIRYMKNIFFFQTRFFTFFVLLAGSAISSQLSCEPRDWKMYSLSQLTKQKMDKYQTAQTQEETPPASSQTQPLQETHPSSPQTQALQETPPSSVQTQTQPQQETPPPSSQTQPQQEAPTEGPVINFNNVSIVEFLRFVSKLTGKNFIFDPQDLQFTVTIISESPATLDDIMAALLQNLQIHDFELIQQGTSFLIHKNKAVKSPAGPLQGKKDEIYSPQIATQVFLIQYVDPTRVAAIVKTMVAKDAIVDLIADSKRLVVTDVAANLQKIGDLLVQLDSPHSGLEIGQYVSQNTSPADLIALSKDLLDPITAGQTFTLVPHLPSNSVFVVASPFLVEKALSIMQKIDLGENVSGITAIDDLKFDPELAKKVQKEALQKILKGQKFYNETEVQNFDETELKKILREMGFTDADLKGLSLDQLRKKLLQEQELRLPSVPFGGISPEELRKRQLFESALPIGQLESTQFQIHKLQYRNAKDVMNALHSIAKGLEQSPEKKNAPQSDLVTTLNTVQMIEDSNSLVLTGTRSTIQRTNDLIAEIDLPVRQVFIEVLVIDTTITNSLNFGVQWAAKVQRRNLAVEGGLFSTDTKIITDSLNGVTNVPPPPGIPPADHASYPSAVYDLTPQTIMQSPRPGFTTGSIGRKVLFHGHGFLAMSGLVNALKSDKDSNVIMNPKITVEHNVPAEVYEGQIVGIKGSSIANELGGLVTTNYTQQQTGIDLKVTALISSKDTITLIVEQKISQAQNIQAQAIANAPPATINETRTVTRVHMPSDHFLVLSGMITEDREKQKDGLPCLGALPIVGSTLFSSNAGSDTKRALMLFIRPHVIDTVAELDQITKQQQDSDAPHNKPADVQRTVMDDAKEILNF